MFGTFFGGKKGLESMGVSMGRGREVRGYKIERMPVGAYLKALERIENAPADFMEAFFPGKNLDDVLDKFSSIDRDGVQEFVMGVAVKASQYVIALIAELSGIDEDKLINDPNIGLDGLLEIIEAMIEVNRLGESIARVLKLKNLVVK